MKETSFQIFNSSDELPNNWNSIGSYDTFLNQEYLTASYQTRPENMQLYFVGVYLKNELIGIAVFQKLYLKGSEIFRERSEKCTLDKLKRLSMSPIKAYLLILGNMLHTGEHAYLFDESKISEKDFLKTLNQVQKELLKIGKKQKRKVHIELQKDFFESNSIFGQSENYHKVSIQPNMILNLSKDWKSFDDYLLAMTTKYRTRCKRARKKLKGIEHRELNLDDLIKNQSKIYELYKCVSDGAGFNTFLLQENTFTELKRNLKDKCRVFGFYLNDALIGFYTLIENNKSVEAYFLGYDAEYQRDKQLYLNMLYSMIDYAIEHKFEQLVFARTAMEIKSSVGAEPYEMSILIRHKNPLLNRVFKPIFNSIQPTADWQQRKPFKETQKENADKKTNLKSSDKEIYKEKKSGVL